MTINKSNLIWLDLEMTGLEPATDKILEIATVVTDADLIMDTIAVSVFDIRPSVGIYNMPGMEPSIRICIRKRQDSQGGAIIPRRGYRNISAGWR